MPQYHLIMPNNTGISTYHLIIMPQYHLIMPNNTGIPTYHLIIYNNI